MSQQVVRQIISNVESAVLGKPMAIQLSVVTLLAGGHILLEDAPGLGKTSLARALAKSLGCGFTRMQFTPYLLPSDILGGNIYRPATGEFEFRPGPIFTNVLLADEINRTPPKTQAALLEAMQEKSVTAAGTTYKLPAPFFVLATQNPIEQEGTYPLPEAQLDRFMFNVWVDYPSFEEEVNIVKATTANLNPEVSAQLNGDDILRYQNLLRELPVTDNVLEYAVGLVAKTRKDDPRAPELTKKYIAWGAGPRASQNLIIAAKTHAAIKGKYAPDIEDVRAVAMPILRHRIVRNYRAEAEGYSVDRIIAELF